MLSKVNQLGTGLQCKRRRMHTNSMANLPKGKKKCEQCGEVYGNAKKTKCGKLLANGQKCQYQFHIGKHRKSAAVPPAQEAVPARKKLSKIQSGMKILTTQV